MLVPIKQIPAIAKDYILEVMLPKAPNTMERMSLGFIIPYLPTIMDSLTKIHYPKAKMLGIVDDKDNIVLDLAMEGAKSALKVNNGKLVFGNIQFDSSDIDVLYNIAKRYEVPLTSSPASDTAA